MTAMNMIQALNSALDVMLERDPDVLIFGEDVGFFGGVFRVTDGLQQRHGETRVFDAPIAEGGQIAVAIGMGAYGLKPWSSASSLTTSTRDSISSFPWQHGCATVRRAISMHRLPCARPMAAASSAGRRTAKVRRGCSLMCAASRR